MKDKLVYTHTRLDSNEVFYVGIGGEKRPYNKTGRNIHWKRITMKHDYRIDIVSKDLDVKEACEIEKYLIKYYGRKDLGLGELVNMTDGGECNKNRKVWNKGIKHNPKSFDGFRGDNHPKPFLGKKRPEHSMKLKGRTHDGNLVLDVETGVFYYSVNEYLRINNNISKDSLINQLLGRTKNKTTLRYV